MYYGTEAAYYRIGAVSPKTGLSVLLSSFALSLIVVLVVIATERAPASGVRRVAQIAFVGLLLVAVWKVTLNPYSRFLASILPAFSGPVSYLCHLIAALAVGVAFARNPNRTFRASQAILLVFFPFVLLSVLQLGVWLASDTEMPSGEIRLTGRPTEPAATRVVWLLFDELDAAVAFGPQRPMSLPQFDRLASEGFSNLDVAPSALMTLRAIPEMTDGEAVPSAEPAGPRTLLLNDGDSPRPWTARESVFGWASSRGLRVGVAGWFHPYCRIFGPSLAACTSEPGGSGAFAMRSNIVSAFMPLHEAALLRWTKEWRLAAARVLKVGVMSALSADQREIPYIRKAQLGSFQRLRRAALAYAADPRLDFVFVHMPVPHPVGIYDRSTAEFSLSGTANYLDNLALADRTLGEIRRSIRGAGLQDRTVLVVNSDHPVREFWRDHVFWSDEMERALEDREDLRVPLFVSAPGGCPPPTTDPSRTRVVYDLLKLLLQGETPSSGDWRRWMATRYPDGLPSR